MKTVLFDTCGSYSYTSLILVYNLISICQVGSPQVEYSDSMEIKLDNRNDQPYNFSSTEIRLIPREYAKKE